MAVTQCRPLSVRNFEFCTVITIIVPAVLEKTESIEIGPVCLLDQCVYQIGIMYCDQEGKGYFRHSYRVYKYHRVAVS